MTLLNKTIAVLLLGSTFSAQATEVVATANTGLINQHNNQNAPATTAPAQDKKTLGLIMRSQVNLKSAPKDSASNLAELWQGEWVEIRGKRLDYLKVYDYKRERAGYIKASLVRQSQLKPQEAGELLTLVNYLNNNGGSESLGISLASTYLVSAPEIHNEKGAQALYAIGRFADRLAMRASNNRHLSKHATKRLTQQLEVATQHGIHFKNITKKDSVKVCYDGEVYRQLLAMPATDEMKAHAALSLTSGRCISPEFTPVQQAQHDVWRAEVIQQVNTDNLAPYLKNKIAIRKAAIQSALSFARSRFQANTEVLKLSGIQSDAKTLMQNAYAAFGQVSRSDLPDKDWPAYNNAAMLVNANRWALKDSPTQTVFGRGNKQITLTATPRKPGETCITLSAPNKSEPLLERCTYSLVWMQSASINQKQNAIAIAVQPMAGWRELWLMNKNKAGWSLNILPATTDDSELGYAEFAGWSPNGKQILLAKESRATSRYQRRHEVVNLGNLTVARQARDASILGAFNRWADPIWKAESVSNR